MTDVVEVRESACHHRKWTSPNPGPQDLQELVTTQELSREMVQSQGAGHKLHQLVGLDTQTTAYAYDHADNLTTLPDGSTMTYDPAGQLQTLTPTSGTATNYGFDGVGNRTTATGGTTATYGYNQENQLTTSATAAGSATYSYNGDSLRAANSDVAGAHHFTWDQLTASLPLLLNDDANDYVYGPNDKIVEQVATASGTTTYLHRDRAGSTRLITDGSGTVVESCSYDPYGNTISRTGSASSPFGYDGEYTDPSGLLYLRARYYDPATGQFLTLDPFVDSTRSPYGFAGDDPINNADPTGGYEVHRGPDADAYGYGDAPSQARPEPAPEAQPTPYSGGHEKSVGRSKQPSTDTIPKPMPHPIGNDAGGRDFLDVAWDNTVGAVVHHTVGLCVYAGGGAGPFGQVSGCVAFVGGRFTLIGTTAGGGGTPGASAGGALLISNASKPDQLKKSFAFAGGSGGIGVVGGDEVSVGNDANNNTVWANTTSVGAGGDALLPYPIPVEGHGGASYSWTWSPW